MQQNEPYQERGEKDTGLVMEPSGSENISSAAHGPDDSRSAPPAGHNTTHGVELPPSQIRAAAPSGLLVTPVPPHDLHPQGQTLDQYGHPGSGNLLLRQLNDQVLSSFSKQRFDPAISSGAMPGHGSLPSFGRGQSQFRCQFTQLVPHDQGNLPQRMHCKPLGEIPPGALGKTGGMFISEKHALNEVGVEKLTERRPLYSDSRRTYPNLQGALGQGSWGPIPRINKPPGVDPPLFLDQEERLKSLQGEHIHASSVDLTPQVYDNRGFKVELKGLHDPIAKHGNQYILGSRFDGSAFEKAVHGLATDGGGSTSSRMLPPYGCDVVSGKRPFGPSEDKISSRMHTDVLGFVPSYNRRRMEGSLIRTPGEYDGLPLQSFRGPPGISRGSLRSDDIVRSEAHLYGDPVGSSFPENRFQGLPGHLSKSRLEYPENLVLGEHLRNGDMMGHNLLSHVRRRELLGPQNLRMGEHSGFGPFHGHAPAGEPVSPEAFGGQLGFGRSQSLQRHSTDGYKVEYYCSLFNELYLCFIVTFLSLLVELFIKSHLVIPSW